MAGGDGATMSGGLPVFEKKVLPALEKAFRAAKRHGYPFIATVQISEKTPEDEALFSSFWHLPACCSATLPSALKVACPEYEQVLARSEEEP